MRQDSKWNSGQIKPHVTNRLLRCHEIHQMVGRDRIEESHWSSRKNGDSPGISQAVERKSFFYLICISATSCDWHPSQLIEIRGMNDCYLGSFCGLRGRLLVLQGCQITEKVEMDRTVWGVGNLRWKFSHGYGTLYLGKRCKFSVAYKVQCVELCLLYNTQYLGV